MRKILMLISLIIISSVVFSEGQPIEKNFYLTLNKTGETSLLFAETDNHDMEKARIVLGPPANPTSSVSEDLAVIWTIYSTDYSSTSSARLSLIFESSNGDSYMLRKVNTETAELDKNNPGLNYSVTISEYSSSSGFSKPDNIVITESSESRSRSDNTIILFDNRLNPYSGESGYANLAFVLDPPTIEGNKGFPTGQYKGRIVSYLVVD